jgi:hypothetical protein
MAKTSKPLAETTAVQGEHIFASSYLEPLAIKWKDLNAQGKHDEAMLVLEEIVVGSTQMFERMAQHEGYHYTVDLDILVSAAQEKVVKWLLRWQRKKGKLFTWFSKCAKNAFRSELVKVNQFRKRYHVTSDNLEKFYPGDDPNVDRHDLAAEARARLANLTCRWGNPQEIGAIHFLIECILDDEHDKVAAIKGAAYAYGISMELSKFFYAQALTMLRDQMYKRIRVPFTHEDLIRLAFSYTDFVTLFDLPNTPLTWNIHGKYMVAVKGGSRVKIPTVAQIDAVIEAKQIFDEIDASDKDPDSVAEIAARHGKNARTAQEIYTEMSEILDPRRSGEFEVYEGQFEHHS